jgi:uncharacterized protein (DUF983 family)
MKTIARGFTLRCPACGEADTIKLSLADATTLACSDCSEEFDRKAVEGLIGQWQLLLDWLETAPTRKD